MITMSLNSIFHVIGLQPWRVNRIISKNIIEESFTLIMTGVRSLFDAHLEIDFGMCC